MNNQKQIVKFGIGQLEKKMTIKQALAWGKKNMPSDLRKAGFEVTVYQATEDINGWSGLRVNYGKRVNTK